MPRKNMKSALSASLQAEDEAVKNRFKAADRVLSTSQRTQTNPTSSPAKQHQSSSNRVIRDSFTLPIDDYELIAAIRERCLDASVSVTKSEVIRAGLQALMAMPDAKLLKQVNNVEKIKPGRPGRKDK